MPVSCDKRRQYPQARSDVAAVGGLCLGRSIGALVSRVGGAAICHCRECHERCPHAQLQCLSVFRPPVANVREASGRLPRRSSQRSEEGLPPAEALLPSRVRQSRVGPDSEGRRWEGDSGVAQPRRPVPLRAAASAKCEASCRAVSPSVLPCSMSHLVGTKWKINGVDCRGARSSSYVTVWRLRTVVVAVDGVFNCTCAFVDFSRLEAGLLQVFV